MRCARRATIFFGFVDASGLGFGSSLRGTRSALIIDGEVVYRHGDWGPADRKNPSNTKEYRNLVNAGEDALERGLLGGCKVFMFTDNMVTEGAYYKVNSPSQDMYECNLSLKELEMEGDFLLQNYTLRRYTDDRSMY